MEEIKFAEELGKEILDNVYDYYEEISMDDGEYIPLVKRIIEAIYRHIGLSDVSKFENKKLKDRLIKYSREQYIETCQINAKENDEDISSDQVKEESIALFDYIYKHEKYPE